MLAVDVSRLRRKNAKTAKNAKTWQQALQLCLRVHRVIVFFVMPAVGS
jgi:hypothetical protein